MSQRPAIELLDIGVRYRLTHERITTLKETVINFLLGRRTVSEDLWALSQFRLEIETGTSVGVIGRNGSGKSTLLQVVAGVLEPTAGRVITRGEISSLLQLGAGFDPELNGTDNIYLSGSLQGMPRRLVRERIPEIVEFSGLGLFIDVPVKNYSAGMYLRLGFSVAVHTDPDILLVDEALAVGDEAFQKKCFEKIGRFRDDGKTMLIVSHALEMLSGLCDRFVLVEGGRVVADGPPGEVIDRYHRLLTEFDGGAIDARRADGE